MENQLQFWWRVEENFDKIKSKESQTGVKELFVFKQHHPDVDTEPYGKESSTDFQTLIRNQLKCYKMRMMRQVPAEFCLWW